MCLQRAGVFRLQFLVRRFLQRRRDAKLAAHERERVEAERAEQQRRRRLELTERSKRVIEKLPPSEVGGYFANRQEHAAQQLQAWWRGESQRRRYHSLKTDRQRHTAAVTIQVVMRRVSITA